MPGIPSLLPPACRRARPRCELLEGRTLLAANVAAPVTADVPVTFAQVSQALRAAWDRLETLAAEAPARSLPMDFDQDERMDRLALLRPEGASSEILDFLAIESGAAENGDFTTRHRLTLGYVAGSLMVQDLDRDGVLDLFLTGVSDGPQSTHATLMLTSLYPSPERERRVEELLPDGRGSDGVGQSPERERRVEDPTLTVAAPTEWPPLIPFPVVARDVTGDDLIDLVVTCPLTDTTWVLRGLGNGRFDDLPWLVRPVGARPIASFVEDFNGDGQLDLVTVDSASDEVTFYSNLASPSSNRTVIAAGGQHPVAALARDVNGDHVPDLIVANHDDGRVSLFLGGPEGLALQETILTPTARPTALASGSSEDARRFYVALDNNEPSQWLSFSLSGNPLEGPETMNHDDPVSPTFDLGPARTEAKLRSLSPAGLDLVPTLVSPLDESEDLAGSAPFAATEFGEPIAGGRAIRGQLALLLSGASLDDEANLAANEGEEREPTIRSEEQLGLQRFLLGVEEADAPNLAPEGGSGPPAMGLYPLPAASEVDSRESPPGETPPVQAGDEGRVAAPEEPNAHKDDERRKGDLLVGARHALVLALASQVGVAWGVLWQRRRKGTE